MVFVKNFNVYFNVGLLSVQIGISKVFHDFLDSRR